jgi:hypothetical protein
MVRRMYDLGVCTEAFYIGIGAYGKEDGGKRKARRWLTEP